MSEARVALLDHTLPRSLLAFGQQEVLDAHGFAGQGGGMASLQARLCPLGAGAPHHPPALCQAPDCCW